MLWRNKPSFSGSLPAVPPGLSLPLPIGWAAIALLYYAAAQGGLTYAVVANTVSLVWPPSGFALVVLLVLGRRAFPGVMLGAFLANLSTGVPLHLVAAIAIGNTLEAMAGAFLLQRFAHFRNALDRRRDVLALIVLSAVVSTTLSAGIGASSLTLGGAVPGGEYFPVALKWWLGDMMGVLVVAPPLLVCVGQSRPNLSRWQALEALGLFAILLVAGYVIFGTSDLAGRGYYPASLAIFPLVIWGALRFEQWGATLVTLLVSALAIGGTIEGLGPFAVDSPVDSLIRWCAFVNVVAATGLLLAAANAEQRRVQEELRRSHDELERRVMQRTSELAAINLGLKEEMAKRLHLEGRLIRVSEEQQRAIGRELHDGLGQHLTSIAFFGASLQQRLAGSGLADATVAGRMVELLNEAIGMTRAVARGLYPAALESEGLVAALGQLADQTRSLKSMACDFQTDADMEVRDPLVAINLYRFAQEAINNAVKHSHGSHLRLCLQRVDGNHRLAVSDNGIGFDPGQVDHVHGLGLHSLRCRASLLGGSFSMERHVEGGMTVAVMCPAPREEDHERP